jgi:hypothetical protein
MFESQTTVGWGGSLLWLGAIAVASFLVSWLLTDRLGIGRVAYVGALALVAGFLTAGYIAWSGAGAAFWTNDWAWGIAGALITGAFLSLGVGRVPVARPGPRKMGAGAVLWDGVVYGAAEGLLLSVLPVVVIWQGFAGAGWTHGWRGILAGLVSLAASAVVIGVHHLGYREFRGEGLRNMRFPVMGCSVLSLGYLVTASPIAAMGGHFILHVAMMIRGVELPPHPIGERQRQQLVPDARLRPA